MTNINSILTTEQFNAQQANSIYREGDSEMLGRDAFLQLFTAQLKNQNPLDPMENEAFVAQLAQFSSVEGIKGMQSSLETLVGNLREQSLLNGSTLVGNASRLRAVLVRVADSGLQKHWSVFLMAPTSSACRFMTWMEILFSGKTLAT